MYELIGPYWHPIIVHFTLALLGLSAMLYLVAQLRKQSVSARIVADWTFAIGAASLLATVGFGFMAYYTVTHDDPSHLAMTDHRNWALVTTLIFLALALWRWRSNNVSALFTGGMILAAILLAVTGFKGGHLVFQYGLGVQSMPVAEGPGHDHDHGDSGDHADAAADGDSESDDHAHSDETAHEHPVENSTTSSAQILQDGSPEAVAEALDQALVSGDEGTVRDLLDPNVLILEGGGSEQSLEEYANGHMKSDMAFLAAIETETLSRRSGIQGESAWVATETRMEGEFRDQPIALKAQETLVMSRSDNGWRITHIHWSSGPLASDHSVDEAASEEAIDDGHDDHEH